MPHTFVDLNTMTRHKTSLKRKRADSEQPTAWWVGKPQDGFTELAREKTKRAEPPTETALRKDAKTGPMVIRYDGGTA